MTTIKFLILCFICALTSMGAIAGVPINAQFIQVELPGSNRILSLAEVEVYSGLINIAGTGKTEQSSTKGKAGSSLAIDGDVSGVFFKKSVSHTQSENNVWWQLNLGKEYNIDKVVIYNRNDCCADRINPAIILLLDKRKNIIWRGVIDSHKEKYEFEIESSISGPSNNLLINSSFQQQTNAGYPDFWGLHNSAGRSIKGHTDYYGINNKIDTPVSGVNVLELSNSDSQYHHLMLIPRKLYKKLPPGNYTFSLYVKSNVDDNKMFIAPGWAMKESSSVLLTRQWKRYSTSFMLDKDAVKNLQPIVRFPDTGIYYIAAPQLERGSQPGTYTSFNYGSEDSINISSVKRGLKHIFKQVDKTFNTKNKPLLAVYFDYDYYTDDKFASLYIESKDSVKLTADIKCRDKSEIVSSQQAVYTNKLSVPVKIDIPLKALQVGDYICNVNAYDTDGRLYSESAILTKLKSNKMEVRVNKANRGLTVNSKPYYIIGGATGGVTTLPEWYFSELSDHGINTLFVKTIADKEGNYNFTDLNRLLSLASLNDLHVIMGWPLAGHKDADWKNRLNNFEHLVDHYKNNPVIIGWYIIDEPSAYSWTEHDIRHVYSRIKSLDPYRLAMINWANNAIPDVIGSEPVGTLESTDIYSMDYYPFAGQFRSIEGFTETTLNMLLTSSLFNKPAHSWLQLYGYSDAWREPSPDELEYMAYLNFIYGGMVSYWGTKPASALTWSRVSKINSELKILAEALLLNSDAEKVVEAITVNGFIYSLWKRNKDYYLIVLHDRSEQDIFEFDISMYTNKSSVVETLFDKSMVKLIDGKITGNFKPFERRVYLIK